MKLTGQYPGAKWKKEDDLKVKDLERKMSRSKPSLKSMTGKRDSVKKLLNSLS
jgi:hypothetical protein